MALSQDELAKRQEEISVAQDLQTKIMLMIDLGFDLLYTSNVENAQRIFEQAENSAQTIDYKDALGRVYLGKAAIAHFSTKHEESIYFSDLAVATLIETGNKEALAETYASLGMARWSQGEYGIALEYTFKGQQLYQEIGESSRAGYSLYLLGSYYLDLKDPDSAEKNFLQARELAIKDNSPSVGHSRSLIGLANVALQRTNYALALEYLQQAQALQIEEGDQYGLSRTYNDFGKVYQKLNQVEQAYGYYDQSLAIRLTATDKQALITTYLDLGEFSFEQQKYAVALDHLQNGLQWAEKLQARVKIYRAHFLLSQVYEAQKEFDKAFQHLKQHNLMKELVMGKDVNLKIRNLETQIAKERSEKEAEIYRLKNVELKQLYDEIEHKNREITDSIEYARRIQDAMLPLPKGNAFYNKQAFFLYQPRDIVSGDFYWLHSIPSPDDSTKDVLFAAAVDCTGHGVPGAFMSMIGNDMLDKIIIERGISEPKEILKQMHEGIHKALKQDKTDNRDGMDIALAVIDEANKCLHFAGANSPLVYVQDHQLHLIKGNRFGIGGGLFNQDKVFAQHTVHFGDTPTIFYIFSDGFQDQFGGPENKKFMKPRFRQLLFDHHHLPVQEQLQTYQNVLQDWMGDEAQVDDILVMGIRVGG